MDLASIDEQAQRGVKPDLGMVWIGPWTLEHGWGDTDRQLSTARQAGVTPVIQFYYWGDDISQDCLENGCYSSLHDAQKTKEHWQTLAQQLVDHLHQQMGGEEVVIVLETEFNKNDVTTYEPLDAYLAEKADYLHEEYPASTVVLGLGNWGRADWDTWDQAAAASDWTGIQGLRGSTRDSQQAYLDAFDEMLRGAQALDRSFGKPVMLTDIGLSTYPEPEYLRHQETVLQEFFDRLDELKATGVTAMMYRSFYDNPNFDTANYYGEAERYWGLARPGDGTTKPAFDVWKQGVLAERGTTSPDAGGGSGPPTAGAGADAAVEAEAFERREEGGEEPDGRASNATRWNLWANGSIEQTFPVDETGVYALGVRATGHAADGTGPHMVASWDGDAILEADPATEGYQVYATQFTVDEPGDHTLQLRFTNDRVTDQGDRNLLLDRVVLSYEGPSNQAPRAQAHVTCTDLNCRMDGSEASDPDGDALTYRWTLGDGSTATGPQVDHTYDAAGAYDVTLTVEDERGAVSDATEHVTVEARARPVVVDAASPTTIEAEAFASRPVGGAESDPDASGDQRWNLWANGSISQRLDVATPGRYEVQVRATGPAVDGTAPHLEIAWDDSVILDADASPDGYAIQAVEVTVDAAGERTLALGFTNDRLTEQGDRNLFLDAVTLVPLTPGTTDGAAGSGGAGGGGGGAAAGGGGGGGSGGAGSGVPDTQSPSETEEETTPDPTNGTATEPAPNGSQEPSTGDTGGTGGTADPVQVANGTGVYIQSESLAGTTRPRPLASLDLGGFEATVAPDAKATERIDLTATEQPTPGSGTDGDASVGIWLLCAAIPATAAVLRRVSSPRP